MTILNSETIEITQLNDEVKQAVVDVLAAGPASIVFNKVDGTVRQMRCTLSPALTPAVVVAEGAERQAKAANPDVRTVYDLEMNAWRSFRWDKLLSVTTGATL